MYAYIKGELAEINSDHIVIETGGIGYQIYIPGQTFSYLPPIGEQLKVYTYLYLREDAMILYGFLTKDDLELFKLLISVSGIGPKGGLAILSTLNADELRFAVLSGDAYKNVSESALDHLVVSDSVPARDNFKKLKSFRQLTLAPMLAEAIRRINNEESISAMFEQN